MDDICKLISYTVTQDAVGNNVDVPSERQVYCQVRSLTRSEFYGAEQAGLKPSFVIILSNYADYEGEKVVEYKGDLYTVLRTYRGTDDPIELTVEPKAGVRDDG